MHHGTTVAEADIGGAAPWATANSHASRGEGPEVSPSGGSGRGRSARAAPVNCGKEDPCSVY
jgi:hypothetical protein